MWHKAPCSSRDYSGVWESGPHKRDEDGGDDGDVDEDDHRGDDSPPDGTPAPPRERRRGPPPCASSSMASPGWGEVLPLVLGLHGDNGPSGILLHGLR